MSARHARLALTTLALAALLAACTLVPTPNPFDVPLDPGGTTVTEEDVYLGATDGALEGTRTFAVANTPMPTETGPFPNADALGSFVAIDVEGGFETPEDAPLLVGLPVPAGADTANLALAVLMPSETIHDDTRGLGESGSAPEPQDSWVLIDGRYDAEGGRLVTALTELPEGGITAAVVASDAFGSPPVGPSLRGQQGGIGYAVYCVNFPSSRASECSSADEATMTAELQTVFQDLESRGFRGPKLAVEYDLTSTNPPVATAARYRAELHPFVTEGEDGTLCLVDEDGSGNHGRYTASLKRIAICWGEPVATEDGGDYVDGRIDTLRHEYFHAIQYAYGNNATSWFKESTAVAAQDSLDTMVRDNGRGVRDVDVQMNNRPQMYHLQDFWIYLGMRFNLGIADVIPFLEAGGDEAALESVFASDYPALGGLGQAYWDWVKNQAFEKSVVVAPNGFANPCGLDTGSSGGFFALEGGDAPEVIAFDFAAPPADRVFTLSPLTSRILRLDFAAMPDADYGTTVSVSGTVASHFYPASQAGTTACIGDPDSSTLPLTVTAGQDQTHFVLIANTDANTPTGVTVDLGGDSSPTLDIVSPLQNAVFDENDILDFQAIAGGFTGANPNLVNVSWSYEQDGIPVVFGNSKGGETFSERLCDGAYTVTATAVDATAGGGSASDTVSFVVNDLGSSGSPPAECAPTITILEPGDGQTFAVGQTIGLRAGITDDDPTTDDPLYPITWRDGGPSGTIVGMGLESSTKLGEGSHDIYVSYGVASDTVTITVEAGNPPNATITFPSSDDVFIPYTDLLPTCNGTYSPTGLGTDTEDGVLTDDALSWTVRVNGGASSSVGTGSPVDLFIMCGNTYEVTLTVTDSDGLQDNDTVTITVGAPPS